MFTPIGSYIPSYGALSNITPFTYKDGETYLIELARLRTFVNTDLIAAINSNFAAFDIGITNDINGLIETVNTVLSAQEQAVENMLAAYDTQVTEQLSDQNADVATANAAQAAALVTQTNTVNTAITNLTTYVNAQVALIISNSITAQDSVVAGLVNTDGSLTRIALDARYLGAALNDAAMTSLINNVSSTTRIRLEELYITPTELSAAITALDGTIDTRIDIIDGLISTINGVLAARLSDATLKTVFNPHSISGTYAARPAANTVLNGTIYYATDVPESYRSDATNWIVIGSGGNQVGYAESAVTFDAPSTSRVDVPSLTTTFKVGERPVSIEMDLQGFVSSPTPANTVMRAFIVLDGVDVGYVTHNITDSLTVVKNFVRKIKKTGLVAGTTHTAKIQIQSMTGSGLPRTFADATNSNSITVVTL